MRIHVGCKLRFEFPQTTPMIATLNVHFSRISALERPDYLITNPSVWLNLAHPKRVLCEFRRGRVEQRRLEGRTKMVACCRRAQINRRKQKKRLLSQATM